MSAVVSCALCAGGAAGATLLQRPELMTMFRLGREGVDQYLKKDDWHFWVNMKNGQVTMPLFQNLEAFWPGTLSMVGDTEAALKSLHNYHQVLLTTRFWS